MLCSECGKNAASIHFTKIINGVKIDLNLCKLCANKKGDKTLKLDTPFSFQQLLSGLLNFDTSIYGTGQNLTKEKPAGRECPTCGLEYSQFSKSGRFGCSECYTAFADSLESLFRRIHGNTHHRGKIPEDIQDMLHNKRELERLREELQKKVQLEEFEEAANLRDKIKKLQREDIT